MMPAYVPACSPIERKAYAAAHRIVGLTVYGETDYACPGMRRTAAVDRVAKVLMEEFEADPASGCTK